MLPASRVSVDSIHKGILSGICCQALNTSFAVVEDLDALEGFEVHLDMRGELAGRPVLDGNNSDPRVSKTV